MVSTQKGGMHYLLLCESIGRSRWNDFPTAGANFHFNAETGEILSFDNKPETPTKAGNNTKDIFMVAVNIGDSRYRILNYIPKEDLPELVRQVLSNTADSYNRRYGFGQKAK